MSLTPDSLGSGTPSSSSPTSAPWICLSVAACCSSDHLTRAPSLRLYSISKRPNRGCESFLHCLITQVIHFAQWVTMGKHSKHYKDEYYGHHDKDRSHRKRGRSTAGESATAGSTSQWSEPFDDPEGAPISWQHRTTADGSCTHLSPITKSTKSPGTAPIIIGAVWRSY